jgi:branched-chain amino acid aminotransferase
MIPVASINGRTIGTEVPGPVTRRLLADFRNLTQKEGTPVYPERKIEGAGRK